MGNNNSYFFLLACPYIFDVEWFQFIKIPPPQKKCNNFSWFVFYKKRFYKAVLPFCLWSVIYAIPMFLSGNVHLYNMFEFFIQVRFNGYMWFFIPLFAFYLSLPILSSWLKIASEKEILVYLATIFLLLYVIQPLFRFMDWGWFNYNIIPMGSSLLMYPMLGHLIDKHSFFLKCEKKIYLIAFFAALLHICLLYLTIVVWEMKSNRFQNVEEATSLLMAIAVFQWFMKHNWESTLTRLRINSSIVRKLASCSLGIYLIQGLLFQTSNKYGFYLQNPYLGAFLT